MSIYEATKNRLALRLRRLLGAYLLGNITKTEMGFQRTKEITQARQQIEALRRIPAKTPAAITYFSVKDEWVYTAVMDNHVCPLCLAHEYKTYEGNKIRTIFPYLEILDLETIHPHVHPNCRCHLDRTLYFGDIGVER